MKRNIPLFLQSFNIKDVIISLEFRQHGKITKLQIKKHPISTGEEEEVWALNKGQGHTKIMGLIVFVLMQKRKRENNK
mgnify:CR=1 FL=1